MHAAAPQPAADVAVDEALGLIGSGSVNLFLRLAKDSRHAPQTAGLVTLSRMAAAELTLLDAVERVARTLGVDAEAAMTPFRGTLDDFDSRTSPNDWWERVVKTYVGYGVIRDFQREVCVRLPEALQEELTAVVGDSGYSDWVVAEIEPVLAADAQLAARLALWGRRVMGEALTAVRQVLAAHPALLPAGGDTARVLAIVTERHALRLGRLGLTA